MFETIKGIIGDIAAGAIKDQRILLSQEQLIALDLKLREALSENERLSQRLKELERLVAERQRQIDQLNKATQPARDLPEESEKMLVMFANSSRGITSDKVIVHMGFSQAKGDHYFDQLLKRKFVHTSTGQMGVGWFYHATSAGRDYLARRGFYDANNGTGQNAPLHVYELRPHKDHRGLDLISDVLPFGRLWYGEPNAEMTMTAGGSAAPW
jgi:hypothetical protein